MAVPRVQPKQIKSVKEPRGQHAAAAKASRKATDEKGGSSLSKMLSILDHFTPETPTWSTNALIESLGTSRSTAYRYIKGLHKAGLIGAVGNGYYVLGPRVVELDLQIRTCDPLYQAGNSVLQRLVEATGHSALLCMLFSNTILCVHECLAPFSPEHMFSRGQRRPLFFGAASKVILPYLPIHQLRTIFSRNQDTIAKANLGNDWDAFKDKLAQYRKDGFVQTCGEFRPGVVGIYAPVFNSEQLILGSVGVSSLKEDLPDEDFPKVVIAVKRAAREISKRVAESTQGMDRPPRAVG